jgi:hypothetical protein
MRLFCLGQEHSIEIRVRWGPHYSIIGIIVSANLYFKIFLNLLHINLKDTRHAHLQRDYPMDYPHAGVFHVTPTSYLYKQAVNA